MISNFSIMIQTESKEQEKNNQPTSLKREFEGEVVSDRMEKTVVVKVSRFAPHAKYKKYISLDKRIKAHDENNESKTGDKVIIRESKPISKDKQFVVVKKISGGGGEEALNSLDKNS